MSYTVEGYLNGTACLPPVQSAEARRALFTPARLREFLINLILRILLLLQLAINQSFHSYHSRSCFPCHPASSWELLAERGL